MGGAVKCRSSMHCDLLAWGTACQVLWDLQDVRDDWAKGQLDLSVRESHERLRTSPSQFPIKYTAAGLQNQQSSICGIHKGQSAILHSMHIYFDVAVCGQQCMKSATQQIFTFWQLRCDLARGRDPRANTVRHSKPCCPQCSSKQLYSQSCCNFWRMFSPATFFFFFAMKKAHSHPGWGFLSGKFTSAVHQRL